MVRFYHLSHILVIYRFSALSRSEEESRSKVGASPNRGRGFSRPIRVTPRSSQEQERERAIAAARFVFVQQSLCISQHVTHQLFHLEDFWRY